jgi:hypothetical protein
MGGKYGHKLCKAGVARPLQIDLAHADRYGAPADDQNTVLQIGGSQSAFLNKRGMASFRRSAGQTAAFSAAPRSERAKVTAEPRETAALSRLCLKRRVKRARRYSGSNGGLNRVA